MRFKKKNVARLASLSALGAGALGVVASTARAGIIYTPLHQPVGFESGDLSSVVEHLPGGAWFSVRKASGIYTSRFRTIKTWQVNLSASTVEFKPGRVVFGRTWNTTSGVPAGSSAKFGSRRTIWSVGSGAYQKSSGINGYFYKLFRFGDGPPYSYGWAYFYLSGSPDYGPEVIVAGLAYNDPGLTIAAGDTGPVAPSTPEPSTMDLTGLAALALGATGLRRWRAARQPAA